MSIFPFSRRSLLAASALLVIGPCFAGSFMNSAVDVTLSISDQRGQPIPHATVWAFLLPRSSPLAVGGEDLRRLTSRYRSSFEVVTPFNRIVPMLEVMPLSNEAGIARFAFDYKRIEGEFAVRPPSMTIGFAILKRGYEPQHVEFTVKDQSQLNDKIVLVRDTAEAAVSEPYLKEFEWLRYELSDTIKNAEMSQANLERLNGLRKAMQAAATQAESAKDPKAAARIYARMQYLPLIRVINGKVAGYSQADPYSEESVGYLVSAYRLDPSNAYIRAKYEFGIGAERFGGKRYQPGTASEARQAEFAEYLKSLHRLFEIQSSEIWPTYHELYATWHRKSSDPQERERMIPLLEELYRAEPKFKLREQLLKVPR